MSMPFKNLLDKLDDVIDSNIDGVIDFMEVDAQRLVSAGRQVLRDLEAAQNEVIVQSRNELIMVEGLLTLPRFKADNEEGRLFVPLDEMVAFLQICAKKESERLLQLVKQEQTKQQPDQM